MANATTHAAICHPCFLDSELAGTSKKQRSSGDLMVVAEREIRLLIGVGRIGIGRPGPSLCAWAFHDRLVASRTASASTWSAKANEAIFVWTGNTVSMPLVTLGRGLRPHSRLRSSVFLAKNSSAEMKPLSRRPASRSILLKMSPPALDASAMDWSDDPPG